MKTRLKFLFLLFIAFGARAQELLPFVENFTKSQYNGDNQVWSIAQGDDNAMYFANNHYFLRYDGVNWERYALSNNTIIRSVFVDGDKVYTGSYNDFGYWKRVAGKMVYTSLAVDKKYFSESDNEEIWKIFSFGNKLYFQTFNEVFILDKKTNDVEKVKFPYQISYCYVAGNEVYVATVRHGIYVMRDTKFIKKERWLAIEGDVIHNIESFKGKIYVFTKNKGIFVEESGELIAWNNPVNNRLKNDIVISAKFVGSDVLAIGTGLQGLYLLNLKNNTYRNINRENAIKNNAILSLAVDKENDLWLGLDNGIAHVEINSPVEVFSDNSGIVGSVYALYTMGNGFIFVTNHGIFTYRDNQLQPIPNSQGQVWDIYKHDDRFVIGHNDGTYVFDGTELRKINTVNGGWKFLKSDVDGVYYQSNYSGIARYKDINDLSKYQILPGFTKPVRNIAQNKPLELWAADYYRSFYRITFDADFNVRKIENISRLNGIENDYGVKILKYRNELLFLINKTWYTYNSISGKLVKDPVFNAAFKNISDIIPVDDESFIVQNDELLYVITQSGNQFKWELIPEKYYQGKVIFENTKAYKSGDVIYLNLDDGFISYKPKGNAAKQRISVEGFYNGDLITDDTSIKYNQPVELHVISQYFGFNRPNLYYRLNESGDYLRVNRGHLILNNLSGGTQNVSIYSFDGKRYVKVTDYKFYVNVPWYFSIWMVLIYIAVIAAIFFFYYRWNRFRTNQKLELKEEELKHQREIIEIELSRQNELNMQEYEKHILELEVQTKSSEVAGKSLSIAKQSEMIENIEKILDSEVNIGKLKSEIKKVIKFNSLNKHEWESFESNLSQIHNEFIKSLSRRFPQLTSKDIRLCIYLRMNLSSKEIAPLMNISFRGVELHRYRLRKKLGITADVNISKYMLGI
ncbi:MAG: histidine kinase [Flavobacterium sp.]|uniref:histidine kinase n=1 Tax=Flavobacterium sp. TaxID=239 RepID=UPI001203E8E6|nr:histidine kinase [Flavobacterium sp.]RZJ65208.1 MAG: histidine kinase [Flavobacterium sp.]